VNDVALASNNGESDHEHLTQKPKQFISALNPKTQQFICARNPKTPKQDGTDWEIDSLTQTPKDIENSFLDAHHGASFP
jgi:hypothetical protein